MAALRFKLAHTVTSTPPPPITLAAAWGAAYVPTAARPLLDLSQGVPGAPPPQAVLDAVAAAARDPAGCGYGPPDGELALRRALADEMRVVYGRGADVRCEDVVLTAGCNMSFVAVAMTLAAPGDEVILPVPWYFNHQMTLQMLGVRTVPLWCRASDGFLPSVTDCAKLITQRTRAIVLVSPNNPTGAIFPPELLASFAALATQHEIALVIDETYRDFIAGGPPHTLFGADVAGMTVWEWRKTFVHLFSFSKSYRVPGHRLGAIIASPTFLHQVKTVLDCIQICPPRPIQMGLSRVLPNLRPFICAARESLIRRHKVFRSVLPSGWTIGSQGGYYAFVRHPFKGVASLDVCMTLAKKHGLVTLPASFFGFGTDGAVGEADLDEGWIRFSVANVDEDCLGKVGERLTACAQTFENTGDRADYNPYKPRD